MSRRFNSYRNNLILTSVFALMAFVGGYHLGSQQNNREVRPEIRSSNTPIVQVNEAAAARLQQQVEQDGGSIETSTPTLTEENGRSVSSTGINATIETEAKTPQETQNQVAPQVEEDAQEEMENLGLDEENTQDEAVETETPTSESAEVEAPTPEQPTAEVAPAEAEVEEGSWWDRNITQPAEKAWDATTEAVKEYVVQPAVKTHNVLNENVYQPTLKVADEYVVQPTVKAADEYVGQPVKKLFSSDEEIENEPSSTAEKSPEVKEGEVPASSSEKVEPSAATDLEEIWGATKDFENEYIVDPIDEHVVKPAKELFSSDEEIENEPSSTAEKSPEVKEGEVPASSSEKVEPSAATDLEEIWGATKDFENEYIVDPIDEHVVQPVVQAADEYVGQPVKKLFSSEEKTEEVPEVQKEQSDAQKTEESWWSRSWNRTKNFFGFAPDNAEVKTPETDGKPTGLNPEEPSVVKTVSPTGAREQVPQTPDMSKLEGFLRSKGLSDADIQTAVALARGQDISSPVAQADKPWYEKVGEDIEKGFKEYVADPAQKHVIDPLNKNIFEPVLDSQTSEDENAPEVRKDTASLKQTLGDASHPVAEERPTYELAKNIPTNVSITVNGPLYQAHKNSSRT